MSRRDLLPAAALYCVLHDTEWDPGERCEQCAVQSVRPNHANTKEGAA